MKINDNIPHHCIGYSSDSPVQRPQAVISTKEYPSKGQEKGPREGLQGLTGGGTNGENQEEIREFEGWA